MGVQPKENTTMNKKMKVIPALACIALPLELSRPVTMAKIHVIIAVEVSRILRRPKRSMIADPWKVHTFSTKVYLEKMIS